MKINVELKLVLIFGLLVSYAVVAAEHHLVSSIKHLDQVIAPARSGPWETIRQDQGVTLSTRWLQFSDTLRTRMMSLKFTSKTDVHSLLFNLTEPEKFMFWNEGVRNVNMLWRGDSAWIMHIVYDIPPPFSQQDLIIMHEMEKRGKSVIVHLYALPDYIPLMSNVKRQRNYYGKWELRELQNNVTDVQFCVLSFARSNIPRFVKDPIIQNSMMRSFIKLKNTSVKDFGV